MTLQRADTFAHSLCSLKTVIYKLVVFNINNLEEKINMHIAYQKNPQKTKTWFMVRFLKVGK